MSQLWISVDFEAVKAVTDRAVLFVIEGEEVWIPKSQISPDDVDQYEPGDGDGSVSVSEWIANEKGLG
jgi:hypothetical protein